MEIFLVIAGMAVGWALAHLGQLDLIGRLCDDLENLYAEGWEMEKATDTERSKMATVMRWIRRRSGCWKLRCVSLVDMGR